MKDLRGFTGVGYDKGRSKLVQAAWLATQGAVLQHWWCPPKVRMSVLRMFGAKIGRDCLVRHRVRIHWPWKLELEDSVWIGEGAWILNLEPVRIGNNTCVSQEVFLCTGSHLFDHDNFEFDNAPITIGARSWLAARSTILRGVTVGDDVLVGAQALVVKDVPSGAKVLAPKADVREPKSTQA
ncbi:DapH/DapD/GlmU-related protein [Falsarthrobacter nasiphocae]|uniref:Colanic acid biosynthesis acetyltransferase WcaF n=1 Tax=Falsarthrobacter nasiphocae TaxID=189863 RepID=A0AAE4C4R1_9MICC|nr:DapH/DapD/GlmU-related protein [Falsarthrobacter nasiphocae]MDR6891606.1 putative colanic acid biosynthesis acetyltransferase WcaF [Falsarthrobacter nasiphocae]